jgi:glutamate-1-semialdehyde 2,1-aminomutase
MAKKLKRVAVIQARMGSTRMPGKVLARIQGVPLIELLLRRLKQSKTIDQIVVATSVDPRNAPLVNLVRSLGFACEQGSENDVLDRYFQAAKKHAAGIVIRITGDCPLVDPKLVDRCVDEFVNAKVDYLSNTNPPTYPDGLDIEVMTFKALEEARLQATLAYDREHVTPFLRTNDQFTRSSVTGLEDHSKLRWTVDDPEDFEVIKNVFESLGIDRVFGWEEVLKLANQQPELFAANLKTRRDEGATLSTGQKIWKRAKRVIPGGTMLLSKRPEMFLPEQWPVYFSRSKGCRVWDLDGREYIDMSIMGIGTNTLGYGHPEVDEAVSKTVRDGNMSTLNCPEEVYLAEKLIELHPWADMARFARSGGEANAIAIRIARAAVGREKVAICGYHGWHDWYLSVNLGDDQGLDGHLLPGLEPNGVPRNLKGTVFAFNYNRIDELKDLVSKQNIGVIKMEVSRNQGPDDGFLEQVRELADASGAVLIFDECTSGFRETFGGLHKKYGVEPDMAMFGKALGNGYAITAVLGRRKFMEAAQTTFISSTFWTERIGPTAALKTLEVMERERSWGKITAIGQRIRARWEALATEHSLRLSHWGLPALCGFTIQSTNALEYKTLISQEMLKRGYLAGNCVYACTEHTDEILEGYFENLSAVFGMVQECENGRDVKTLLSGPVCHAGFKRLN